MVVTVEGIAIQNIRKRSVTTLCFVCISSTCQQLLNDRNFDSATRPQSLTL